MRDASGDRVAGEWREEFADMAGSAAQALSCERRCGVKRGPCAEKSAVVVLQTALAAVVVLRRSIGCILVFSIEN